MRLLTLSNTAINVFIYAGRHPDFKEIFLKSFKCCTCRGQNVVLPETEGIISLKFVCRHCEIMGVLRFQERSQKVSVHMKISLWLWLQNLFYLQEPKQIHVLIRKCNPLLVSFYMKINFSHFRKSAGNSGTAQLRTI